ncbi:hypothetical protein [Hydrogenimonas sp.]
MKKTAALLLYTFLLFGSDVKCHIENERVYCVYYLARSDNVKGKNVQFHWISPTSREDDRIRHFQIPPYHGSVFDYRFLPGRAKGTWYVVVTDMDTNETVETTFEIDETDDSMFEED